ncbi:protein LONGIFOLIA 1 isoform X2 [Malania oleifera]|uniref:protein LONGIFOLIA 1 isoform X2 n=1 Tax=Malania oleifera TaxID=397392 RepID=UPI0025AE974E|nr:protein LONGIFOLIA 1 isoform X2 [Malania oleifera]
MAAAKLLQSLTDENPDLQKQIGCMTGIFQLFERHHALTGRHINHKRLPSGNSHFNNGSLDMESNNTYLCPGAMGKNSKDITEKQRVSTQSPSCSSSLSQPDRSSLDLRDAVKDSMYRETSRVVKHKYSPRPLQSPKSMDMLYGKQNLPVDLMESLTVLARFREAPCYFNEAKELPRSLHEDRDGCFLSVPKDAPRYSYDGRDTFKSTPKLKELPRLSLDSREVSMRGSINSVSKSNFFSRNLQRDLQQMSGTQRRPPGVVARLMGLEALPDSRSVTDDCEMGMTNACPIDQDCDTFSRSSKANDPIQILNSPKNSWKDPRWKNSNSVMRPISNSKFPIEPAPWRRQINGDRVSQKPQSRHPKGPSRVPNSFPSVYNEIEKRLRDLEFKHSGKDLIALKQILEAMQAKMLLETSREEQVSNFVTQRDCIIPNQNPRLVGQRSSQNDRVIASTVKGANSSKTSESPIVIMKPAKLVKKSDIPPPGISVDDLPGVHKLRDGAFTYSSKSLANNRTGKDQSPKNSYRESAVSSTDKKTNMRNLRSTQTSAKPQQLHKENTPGLIKSSGSVSPRLQQKSLELEKRSRPPIPSSDWSKGRRQFKRQPIESGSPGRKHRPKSPNLLLREDQSSEVSSESRNLSNQGDDISVHSESIIMLDQKEDVDVINTEQSVEVTGSPSPSREVAKYSLSDIKQKTSSPRLNEYGSQDELAAIAPEHPSPVSVLDVSVYQDGTPSPVRKTGYAFRDDGTQKISNSYNEEHTNLLDNFLLNNMRSDHNSQISRKKLQNIENLVQKLRRLNSSHDETSTDYIALLCENANPDHRYISEILLASGLLLRDLGSSLTGFQLHPSGHPINPELFFVLEQTKANTLLSKEQDSPGKVAESKPNHEKLHRKLIFDAVNEILVGKLGSVSSSLDPWLKPETVARKTPSAQKLLRELCLEIEQLHSMKSECNLEDEADGLKNTLREDITHRSESWTNFCVEIPTVVLDVERSIFKDLVNEIVTSEVASRQVKLSRHYSRLSTK